MSSEIFAGQCRYLLFQAEPMLEGLRDEHLHLEPTPGNKTAGWILGHLCITGDFGRRLCGRKSICPPEWRSTFQPGTTPETESTNYPPMADLTRAFREIYTDLCDAILNPDEERISTPNAFEPARPAFPTGREFVPYIMTGHLGYHLGQLGDWRRAAGLGHKGHL
jgi:hypothetical protein